MLLDMRCMATPERTTMTTSTLPCPSAGFLEPRSLGILAVFDMPERAETAVAALQSAGFDMQRLSIVGRDTHSGEHLLGCAALGDRTRFWGRLGPTWDRLARRIVGAAVVFVPFIGCVVMLGAVVDWLVDDQSRHGAGEGATPLWRLLARLGIASREGTALESALRECDIVLLVSGSPAEVDKVRDVLRQAARRRIE
jgi:hypothetical protein